MMTRTPGARGMAGAGDDQGTGPPLLIVGHGSRTREGTEQFLAFTDRVAARAGGRVRQVVGGFLELARPDVGEAVTGLLTSSGSSAPVGTVVAIPLMLSAAGHVKSEIPALLSAQQRRHPGLAWAYGRALGPHPVLQDLLAARVGTALAGLPREDTHVVLVGRGSGDPDANADLARVARLLWEGCGFAGVEVAFEAVTFPRVPEALHRAARLGARALVVAPYLLFPGVVRDRIAASARAFRASHPYLDVRVTGVFGDCDELADLVLDRYREALADGGLSAGGTGAPRTSLPQVSSPRTRRPGAVTLVGAGPGAVDLITVRGARALAEADVVVTDRLVPAGLLAELRPQTSVVEVGKTPRQPSTSQEEINALLVEQARAGRNVVRLKGGDPFVFGRGHEEYVACVSAGVACEVVPGISSAIAAPGLAGVPVTTRGLVHDLCIVTGHVAPGDPNSRTDWAALARLDGTLVIMMGVCHAAKIAAVLIEHGRREDTPVVVVENAATARQRVLRDRLDGLGELVASARVRPPATIVVGAVAALAAGTSSGTGTGQGQIWN